MINTFYENIIQGFFIIPKNKLRKKIGKRSDTIISYLEDTRDSEAALDKKGSEYETKLKEICVRYLMYLKLIQINLKIKSRMNLIQ